MIERVSAAYAPRAYDERAWAAAGMTPAASAAVRFDSVLASVMAASFAPPAPRPAQRQAGSSRFIRG